MFAKVWRYQELMEQCWGFEVEKLRGLNEIQRIREGNFRASHDRNKRRRRTASSKGGDYQLASHQ